MIEGMIMKDLKQIMIPADDVAYLYDFNSLMHGLLVLNQVNYSMIPVVNQKDQIQGLVSINMIIKESIRLTDIDSESLNSKIIKQVDLRVPEFITLDVDLADILHKLVNNNFLCVVDELENKKFLGIITRNSILKLINAWLHSEDWNQLLQIIKITESK